MLRSIRKYSSARRTGSPVVGLLVALALLGVAALKSWWDGASRPSVRPPSPPIAGVPGVIAARVLKVVDGDTFDARIEVRPGLRVTTRVRLRGIDAPELHAACEAERIGAEAAERALRAILLEGGVTIRDLGEDKYGRLLGSVSTRATANVSEALIARGVVRRYDGGRRRGWC
ncbi:MAG: thermonuclease family protein [Rhodoplanes sp.]